ncbi:MAG: hypothetical protein ACLVAT_10735 [Lachnospiraceae bacterium]
MNGGTNALMEYNYLVKKVVFKISVLADRKSMISSFICTCIFRCVCHWFYAALYGYTPSLGNIADLFIIRSAHFMLTLSWYMRPALIVVFFQGSDADYQYFLTGRNLADT